MPMKRENYSDDWEQISYRIRLRANDRCEQCGVHNGELIHRRKGDLDKYVTHLDWQLLPDWAQAKYQRPIRVVLTVAHLDNDTANNGESNLKALCQLHHLRLDAVFHAQNAKTTRAAKKQAEIENNGQMALFSTDDTCSAGNHAQITVFSRNRGSSQDGQS